MSNNALVGLHDPAKRLGVVGASGGRSSSSPASTLRQLSPCKKIEDLREPSAIMSRRVGAIPVPDASLQERQSTSRC